MSGLFFTVEAGEPEFGVWCDFCLLPAAIRISVGLFDANGKPSGSLAPILFCECQRPAE